MTSRICSRAAGSHSSSVCLARSRTSCWKHTAVGVVPWARRSERDGIDGESQSGTRITGVTVVTCDGRAEIDGGNEAEPEGDERSGGK
jgi:hypothetical protein